MPGWARRGPLRSLKVMRVIYRGCVIANLLGAAAGSAHSMQHTPDSTIIQGSVRGSDGRIPVRADVELRPLRAPARAVRSRVNADGTFRLATTAAGPFRLRAAGVGYMGFERALPLDTPTTVRVEVTLAGFPKGLAKGPLIGVSTDDDAEKPRPDMPPAVILGARGNGRRSGVLRAKRDTLAYRIVDLTARVFLPPAGAAAWRWAEDGEYEGLIATKPGSDAQLVYDSTAMVFGGASSLRVTDGHPATAVVAQLDSLFSFAAQRRCLIAAQGMPGVDSLTIVQVLPTPASQLLQVRRLLRADASCQTNHGLGQFVLDQFYATSPLWDLDDVMRRRTILIAARHATGEPATNTLAALRTVRERFDAAIAAAPDTTVRFDLYVRAAETFMPYDTLTAQAYTARFVSESYSHPRVLPLLRLTGYNRVLQPGRPVPEFRVSSLDAGKPDVTSATLLGRVYLLDVWATWCVDCIVELPAMRALHERFGPRGLQLVSVSVDEERATADRFRTAREPMPWLHGWAGVWPENEGPLAAFEVARLPTTILVGKDGRIIALTPRLDSSAFAALIEEALR